MKRDDPLVEHGLPANPDAEKAVLGAIILDNAAYDAVAHILTADDFSVDANRRIFGRMVALVKTARPIDFTTLPEELIQTKELETVGGVTYLSSLTDGLPRAINAEHYARIVKQKANLRRVIYAAKDLYGAAIDGDIARALVHTEVARACLSARGASLKVLSLEELLSREIKPREMLLDPILPAQSLTLLYSWRGVGKTYLSLGIAVAVAGGGHFLRWTAERSRSVLYVDGELPLKTLQERAAMVLAGMEGLDPPPGALRFLTPDIQERPIPDLATREGQAIFEQHLEGIDLLLLDNLSALCRSGKENEGEAWLPVQEWALSLRRRGTSVLFVHHAGKNDTQRGTSRREDVLDTVLCLRRPKNYDASEGLRCEIHYEKTRSMMGDHAKPLEVQMQTGSDGRAVWNLKEVEDARLSQAVELFGHGMTVRDVAEELGISKSMAGRLRQRWQTAGGVPVSQPI